MLDILKAGFIWFPAEFFKWIREQKINWCFSEPNSSAYG